MTASSVITLTTATNAYDLLDEIAELALEEPKRIHMGIVCLRGNRIDRYRGQLPTNVPACNTIGCIAGWVLVKTGNVGEDEWNPNDTTLARKVLGLTLEQGRSLFFPSGLLPSFTAISNAMSPEHAQEVVDHIRRFQSFYEFQLKNTRIYVSR